MRSDCGYGVADAPATLPAAYAKKFATDMAVQRIADCIQAMGANGLRAEYPLSRHLAGAKIAAYIGGVHQRFPGYRFALLGEPEGHGEHLRFSWSLGPDGAEPPIEGSDVVSLESGRIASVVGFLDKVPQPA